MRLVVPPFQRAPTLARGRVSTWAPTKQHKSMSNDYTDFLRQKIKMANFKGFSVEPDALHEKLYPHQRDILKGRKGGGSELNPSYFMDQVHYLKSAEREFSMPTLFDALEAEAA